MSREKIAITISGENLAWMDKNYSNRSALIDDLLTRARKGEGEIDRAVARYQKEQLKREKATLETQMESVEEQLEIIDKRMERRESYEETKLEEAREILKDIEHDPTNPAVKTQAEKLDISPKELVEKLEEDGGNDE